MTMRMPWGGRLVSAYWTPVPVTAVLFTAGLAAPVAAAWFRLTPMPAPQIVPALSAIAVIPFPQRAFDVMQAVLPFPSW